jgi:hypothetical protein
MPGNPLARFDDGREGGTARCPPLSHSTVMARNLVFFAYCNAAGLAEPE